MYHQAVASSLTGHKRKFLISMIDGPHPFVAHAHFAERATRESLFRAGLLRLCGPSGGTICGLISAQFFCLTENGRAVVCCVLAEYAEALVMAERANLVPVNETLTRFAYGPPIAKDEDQAHADDVAHA